MSGIGDRIRQAREAMGLSQEDLAARVDGVSRVAVSQWENGESRPRDKRLEKIAQALHLDYEWLRTGVKSASPTSEISLQHALDPELLRTLILEGFSLDLPAQGGAAFAERIIDAYDHVIRQREIRKQREGGMIASILRGGRKEP